MSNTISFTRGFARALAVSVLTMAVVLSSAGVSMAAGVTASVKTGDTGNGKIDFITVKFSVPMDRGLTPKIASAPGQPGFFVEGYTITGFEWAEAAPAPAQTLKLKLAEGSALDGDAEPVVHYGSGGDAVSALGIEADAFDDPAADGAGPVLLSARVHDTGNGGLFNAAANNAIKGDELILEFSEPAKLMGQTRFDRWSSLEKAIRFNNILSEAGGLCATDGKGLNDFWNFPQPRADAPTAADSILQPAASGDGAFTTMFKIQLLAGSHASNRPFPGVPQGCWIGIEHDSTVNGGNLIVGADGNPAIPQVAGPGVVQPKPTPVEVGLVADELSPVTTLDGVGGPLDGNLDAVEMTFEQAIDLNTIRSAEGQALNVPTVSLGSVNAIVDASQIRHRQNGSNQDITTTVILPFALPAGIEWDTGVKPSVRYTKPFACSADTTANGIKAKVPSGGTWRACVSSFQVSEAFDRAAPIALSAVTTDGDGNGRIDSVTVNFSEPIKQGTANGWTLNGQPATGFAPAAGGRTATIPIAEGAAGDTGSTATVSYANVTNAAQQTKDFWDNQLVPASLNATDGAGPRIQTASVHDLNGDGRLDRAVLTYSEALAEPAPGSASDFKVGGVQATGFASGTGDDANDETLTLAINVEGTGAKTIEFNGTTIKDAANNLAGGQIVDAATVVDQAPAVATIGVEPGAPLGVGLSTVRIAYSEPMDTAVPPAIALDGVAVEPLDDDEHTASGFLTEDASVWEGSVTVTEGACAVSTGCAVLLTATGGEDLGGIAPRAASLATEIDTTAPQTVTLGAFDTGNAPGQSAPANTINMFTHTVSLAAGIAPGEASAGFAEILVDGNVLPGSQSAPIAQSATTASGSKTFADLDALRSALPEGAHTLTVNVCDDAGNCEVSADSVEVLVDTVSVAVELVSPEGGDIAGGGESRTIAWNADETAADFDHVELDLSTNNGTSYATAIDHAQPADGELAWTVPALDVAAARIRALTIDAAGNKAWQVSDAFAIDSTAPVVALQSPSSDPFLPAGGTTTIRWTASDATIGQVSDPITLEYSLGGAWLPINSGEYSKANDGRETFEVPRIDTFSLRVRVRATDATGKVTTVSSSTLVAGVAGYVVDAKGAVVRFGSAESRTNETRPKKGDGVAGMALAPGGRTGYVLGESGRLYPFSIGSASKPRAQAVKLPKGHDARDLVLTGTSKGYVLGTRGIVAFGGARAARSPRSLRCNCGTAIVLSGSGGYVLTSRGGLVPFGIGKASAPRRLIKRDLLRSGRARDVVLNANGRSGYVLTSSGKLVAFGGARRLASSGIRRTADAQALVRVTDTGGYWLDAKGTLHRYGAAVGDPTRTKLSAARGAAIS